MNVIIITDAEPSDDPEGVIIQAAKKLDAWMHLRGRLVFSSSRLRRSLAQRSISSLLMITCATITTFVTWSTRSRGRVRTTKSSMLIAS